MRISLEQAQQLLQSGQVVGIPTETVYGLAASLLHSEAIRTVFSLKGRPSNNPLIVHIADRKELDAFQPYYPPDFDRLAQNFWPGPLTMVIPVDPNTIPHEVRAGLPTVAVRMPQHPLTLQLLKSTGPLVMPSANLSGKPSATSPEHVEQDFGREFPVLDGGECVRGLESTILFHTGSYWEVIRQGALPPEAFSGVLGYTPKIANGKNQEKPLCPGQLHRHYAPKAKLHLVEKFHCEMQGPILGFADRSYPQGCRVISLGLLSKPETIAENLYSILRLLDEEGITSVWVDNAFPRNGLLSTIAERLQKASTRN